MQQQIRSKISTMRSPNSIKIVLKDFNNALTEFNNALKDFNHAHAKFNNAAKNMNLNVHLLD